MGEGFERERDRETDRLTERQTDVLLFQIGGRCSTRLAERPLSWRHAIFRASSSKRTSQRGLARIHAPRFIMFQHRQKALPFRTNGYGCKVVTKEMEIRLGSEPDSSIIYEVPVVSDSDIIIRLPDTLAARGG